MPQGRLEALEYQRQQAAAKTQKHFVSNAPKLRHLLSTSSRRGVLSLPAAASAAAAAAAVGAAPVAGEGVSLEERIRSQARQAAQQVRPCSWMASACLRLSDLSVCIATQVQ